MDPRRLTLLREFADRGSMSAVARSLHLTPSAVSQQLRALAHEAGVPLLTPSGRGLELTSEGRALAAAAVDVERSLAAAQAVVDRMKGGAVGQVRLAMPPTSAELLLPGVLDALGERAPGIVVDTTLVYAKESEFPALTRDHDIVIGYTVSGGLVGPDPAVRATGTHAVPHSWEDERIVPTHLLSEPLDLAVAHGHPLARRASVRAEELIDQPWIAVPNDLPFDEALRRVEDSAGARMSIVAGVPDIRVIESLIAAGHGVGLLPRYTASTSRVRLLRVDTVEPARQLFSLIRPARAESLAVQAVRDACLTAARAVAASHEGEAAHRDEAPAHKDEANADDRHPPA